MAICSATAISLQIPKAENFAQCRVHFTEYLLPNLVSRITERGRLETSIRYAAPSSVHKNI